METEERRITEKNEKLVRAFYEAIAPGRREPLDGLQAAPVVYEVSERVCTGGDLFEGITDLKHFFHEFCTAFDVHFVTEEFITMDERVVAIGRTQGEARRGNRLIDVPFVHVWTVRDDRLERLPAYLRRQCLRQIRAAL
jgi:ketosteroid isomerase-like protein